MVARPIIWIKIGHLKVKTNGKALKVSIQMNWILKGSKLFKLLISCSRTEYNIFLKENEATENVGN